MTMFDSAPTTPPVLRTDQPILDQSQLAAAAFLARYRGRTLDSYRADQRQFFEWADSVGLAPLDATGPHIELYRAWMDGRGLAPSTPDRRLSTICGYYRFAHLDGRISSNPVQYVRKPRVHPTSQRGMDRGGSPRSCIRRSAPRRSTPPLAVLLGLNGLRVSEACATDVENLGFERGHRTLRIVGKGNKPATIPLVPRTARTLDLANGERTAGPILIRQDGRRLDSRTAYRWVRSVGAHAGLDVHPHMLRAAFIMAALDAGVPLRDVQIAARHADPRTTTIYDRRRQNYGVTPPMPSSPSSPAADPADRFVARCPAAPSRPSDIRRDNAIVSRPQTPDPG